MFEAIAPGAVDRRRGVVDAIWPTEPRIHAVLSPRVLFEGRDGRDICI